MRRLVLALAALALLAQPTLLRADMYPDASNATPEAIGNLTTNKIVTSGSGVTGQFGGSPLSYNPGAPLAVKGLAPTSVVATFEGRGSPSALNSGMWFQFQSHSATRASVWDFREVNSAGVVKDQAASFNLGFQWWDAGHEQSDWDFGGYRNGVHELMMYLSAGCDTAFNTAANNAGGQGCTGGSLPPTLSPGVTNVYNLGATYSRWNDLYLNGLHVGTGTGTNLVRGEIALTKAAVSAVAPGATAMKLAVQAGTTAGTCKLVAYAGTSATPTTIIDNVGAGC